MEMSAIANLSNDTSTLSADSFSTPFTPILPFTSPSDFTALYELGPELGRGQFGIIHRCTSRSSGAIFACKSISKLYLRTPRHIQDVVREVRILNNLSNPTLLSQILPLCCDSGHVLPQSRTPSNRIVRLHDVVEDGACVHLVMELCQGGDLFDRLVKKKTFSEGQAALLMKSLLETLELFHSLGVMHRDLKPENILFVHESDASPIKLADFGLALEFAPGEKFSGTAGSVFYMAPEMLQGEYSEEIDMWSAGVILYVLLSGMPPFWQATKQGILEEIQGGHVDFPPDPWGRISLSAKDLILQMLCIDVELRLTPAQALQHPWIVHHTKKTKRQSQWSQTNTRRACIWSS